MFMLKLTDIVDYSFDYQKLDKVELLCLKTS